MACLAMQAFNAARAYQPSLDETHDDVVPGEVLLPLVVRCVRSWVASEEDEAHLILFHAVGPRLEDVLHVRAEHSEYDRLAHDRAGAFFALVPHRPGGSAFGRNLCVLTTHGPTGLLRPMEPATLAASTAA